MGDKAWDKRFDLVRTVQQFVDEASALETARTVGLTDSLRPGEKQAIESAATVGVAVSAAPDAPAHASPPQPTAPPQPAESRYETMELLGEGGMGRVYAARDRQFGRVVALKELRTAPGSPVDLEALRRFVQESVVSANLEHPGIVAVYERGVREGVPFYAMRRAQGGTLAEAIRAAGTLEERLKLLPVVVRVAHALGYAHERGVVHRDVKPENVVLGVHGETVLLDWGIAKVLGLADSKGAALPMALAGPSTAETMAGRVMGTPAYMAPEQARGEVQSIDARTDVFAVGAMLYEVLTGHAPYRGSALAAVLLDASAGTREPIERAAKGVPEALRAIVDKAMHADREARFANGSELARALESYQTDALLGRDSRAVRWFSGAAGVGAFLALGVMDFYVASAVSTLREQGAGAWFYLGFALLGLAFSVLEWRTAGRYALRGFAVACAANTALLGVANTFVAAGQVLRFAQRPEIMANGAELRHHLVVGAWESVGSIPTSLMLTSLQCLVLGLVAGAVTRRVAREKRAAQG